MSNNLSRSVFLIFLCIFAVMPPVLVADVTAGQQPRLENCVNDLLKAYCEGRISFSDKSPKSLQLDDADYHMRGLSAIISPASDTGDVQMAVLHFSKVDRVGWFVGKNVLSGSAENMMAGGGQSVGGLFALRSLAGQVGVVVSISDKSGAPLQVNLTRDGDGVAVSFDCTAQTRLCVNSFKTDTEMALETFCYAGDNNNVVAAKTFSTQQAKDSDKDSDYVFMPQIGQGKRAEDYVAADDTQWLIFADQDRLFRPLLADQREAQTRFMAGQFFGKGDIYDNPFEVSFGGDLVLVRRKFSPDSMMSLSVRGALASRFDLGGNEPGDGNFPLLNTDFFGGVALAYKTGNDTFELYGYHQSAHMGDETVLTGNYDPPWENYSREAMRFLWSRDIGQLRVYGGGTFNPTSDNEDLKYKLGVQAGSEYRFSFWDQCFYAAADVQAWQYHDFRPSVNTQIGWFRDEIEDNPLNLRIFLEYFNGHSTMGHFWDKKEQTLMLGAGINF